MDPELVKAIFSFGLKVGEHVHGIKRAGDDKSNDQICETVRAVADGNLTLLGTPEEMIASLPTPPPGIELNVKSAFFEMIRVSRENERIAAKMVASALPN